MNMAIGVRVALVSDAAAVVGLTRQLGYEVLAPDVEARLSRILSRADQQFFVAELEGHVVGWLHAAISEYVETGPFVVIGGLVVDQEQRGKGIGRELMSRAEDWAKNQGCTIVRLWSSSFRTAAHRFYEGLGYANIKTQYAFAKSLKGGGREQLSAFIPRAD